MLEENFSKQAKKKWLSDDEILRRHIKEYVPSPTSFIHGMAQSGKALDLRHETLHPDDGHSPVPFFLPALESHDPATGIDQTLLNSTEEKASN